MSILHNLKKIDLKLLAEELGETVPDNAKIFEIKELIENSDLFKTDKEFVRGVVKSIVEDRTTKEFNNQSALEIEKIKLAQLEKEIELQRLKNQSLPGERTSAPLTVENLIKSIKTLTIPVPEKPEALYLFFTSLEKAFATKEVPNGLQAEILINLLGVKANIVLTHATEEELSDYEKRKEIFLAEFQPTPRECLSNFKIAQRLSNESHMQFASRLTATFEYYCQVREIKKDFKRLCDLIVADKLYETLDFKTKGYIGVREGKTWFSPTELGRECDLFFSSRGKSLSEINNSKLRNRSNEPQVINQPPEASKGESFRRNKNQNIKPERICFVCGAKGEYFHFAKTCPRRFEKNKNERQVSNHFVASGISTKYKSIPRNKLEFVDILVGGKKIKISQRFRK
ncbi:hypothetical protein AVEN_7825-1 [Araneus ventricosus]|uniref:CCHC-type domain-containing protein n=1 Tax=Araneus ventricosus TaxID=182803 RepID=A0A4Y2EZU3_ARAVE|nr:hypothetical protein AVEN_7825-1 [Araneus ventricosus]